MTLENISSEENKFIFRDLQAIMKATALEIDDLLKSAILFVKNNEENPEYEKNKVIRKEITRIVMDTSKDRKYL